MNAEIPSISVAARQDALFPPIEFLDTLEVSAELLLERQIYGYRNADTRARPFKLLRSQVRKLSEASGAKLIGITSASPGVGKSFVAANLAAALSRIADVEVYLADFDLHRPALAPRFGLSEGPGILEFLAGEVTSVRDIAKRINDERLVLLPAFKTDKPTGEMLTSTNSDRLFAGLRALPPTAIVLVDMPPIFADDDAVIIAGKIDAFLLVAEDGKTTRKQVRDTIRLLQPTPLLGTVLNRYRNQLFSDDYGYGVGYGYGAYYNNG
jgi:protein-tyrosine kinase